MVFSGARRFGSLARACGRVSLVAVAGAAVFGAVGGAAPAPVAGSGGWKVQPSPNTGDSSYLSGVAATSSTNAWAVGESFNNSTNTAPTLVERWNGSAWKVQTSPSRGLVDSLRHVAATSSTNAWAVGDYSDRTDTSRTLIERWDGSAWKVQISPNRGGNNHLYGVAATSRANAWAVGEYYESGVPPRTLVERWNGRAWKVQTSPDPAGSRGFSVLEGGVAATSSTNAWAVGEYFHAGARYSRTLVERWNGRAWKVQTSPSPGVADDYLYGVAATSPTNAWAVGYYYRRAGALRTLVEHWNGRAWKVQTSPNPGGFDRLYCVAATSRTNAWAVGYYVKRGTSRTLVEHWNGTAWTVQPSPNIGSEIILSGVAATSRTTAWAVGHYFNGTAQQTLVERWG